MRMRLVVEVDVDSIDPNTTLRSIGLEHVRSGVEEALTNAIEYAQGEGHRHALSDDICIFLAAVHYLDEQTPDLE